MRKRVDGAAILQLMATKETEVAKVYRLMAEHAAMGGLYLEDMAQDEERHHDLYLDLAERAEEEGGWVIEEEDYDYFKLRLHRSLLARPDELLERAENIHDKMELFELAERIERETVEIVRELREIVPRFAPEELRAIELQEKAHLKKVTERIRDNFLDPR